MGWQKSQRTAHNASNQHNREAHGRDGDVRRIASAVP